jgi:hypothetical protein
MRLVRALLDTYVTRPLQHQRRQMAPQVRNVLQDIIVLRAQQRLLLALPAHTLRLSGLPTSLNALIALLGTFVPLPDSRILLASATQAFSALEGSLLPLLPVVNARPCRTAPMEHTRPSHARQDQLQTPGAVRALSPRQDLTPTGTRLSLVPQVTTVLRELDSIGFLARPALSQTPRACPLRASVLRALLDTTVQTLDSKNLQLNAKQVTTASTALPCPISMNVATARTVCKAPAALSRVQMARGPLRRLQLLKDAREPTEGTTQMR